MANKKPLIPKNRPSFTSETARESQRKSVEARRRKKDTLTLLTMILEANETDKNIKKKIESLGFKNPTNNLSILIRMMIDAKNGSTKSQKLIYDILHNFSQLNNISENAPTFKIEFVKNEEEDNDNDEG